MGMTERKRGDGVERPTPYRDAAMTYRRGGWQGVLPVPFRTKKLIKPGWTGHEGEWPSGADIQSWMDSDQADEGRGNIAVRMPPDVIGIDVDAYGDKAGKASYFAAEAKWGELPATWMSTARVDGFSGIRFFRIPEGLRWPGQVGPGIETVHVGHRYAMVWPSVHPEGNTYKWYRPDGMGSIEPPRVDDLPELPDAWIQGLTGGELAEEVAFADMAAADVQEWVARHLKFGACRPMEVVRDRLLAEMRTGSAHESLRRLMGLIRLAEQGHSGLADAMGQIKHEFTATAMDRGRDAGEAEREWQRSLAGAVRRVLGVPSIADHGDTVPDDPCAAPFGGQFDDVLGRGDLTAAIKAVETQRAQSGSTGHAGPAIQAVHTVNGVAVAGTDEYDNDEIDDDVVVVDLPSGSPPADTTAGTDSADGIQRERSTWWPVDLDDVLSGKLSEPAPVVLARTDGEKLFYAGKVNALLGESESGKSWVALMTCKEVLENDGDVLYLDFEDSAAGIVGRLLALGVDGDTIREHFQYSNPEESLNPIAQIDLAELMIDRDFSLVVVDGVNAAMTLFGFDMISNPDCIKFSQILLKPLARRGAAVVAIDHVSKSREGRGKGGIGGQAKRAMMTGCALFVDPQEPFGKGLNGRLKLTIDKDRAGHVRGIATSGKEVGMVFLDSDAETGAVRMRIAPAGGTQRQSPANPHYIGDESPNGPWRPTAYMQRVSKFIASVEEGVSMRAIEDEITGGSKYIRTAVERLVDEGFVRRARGGARGAIVHTSIEPFDAAEDARKRGMQGVQPVLDDPDEGV